MHDLTSAYYCSKRSSRILLCFLLAWLHSAPTAPIPLTISSLKLMCPRPLSSVTMSLSGDIGDYACTLTYPRTMRKFSFTSVVPTTFIIIYLTPDSVGLKITDEVSAKLRLFDWFSHEKQRVAAFSSAQNTPSPLWCHKVELRKDTESTLPLLPIIFHYFLTILFI